MIFPANAGVILQIRPAKERYCNIPPRTRGSSRSCGKAAGIFCIFPANAGIFPSRHSFTSYARHIPRERGGQPCVACPGAGMRTFPCICRGQPAAVLLHLTTGIFPANAGVILMCAVDFFARVDIPRERGGQPIIRNRGVLAAVYSPRMRGSS